MTFSDAMVSKGCKIRTGNILHFKLIFAPVLLNWCGCVGLSLWDNVTKSLTKKSPYSSGL
jgi:hypothetical protein